MSRMVRVGWLSFLYSSLLHLCILSFNSQANAVVLGKYCAKTADCSAEHAVCNHRRCRCPPGYRNIHNKCIPPTAGAVVKGLALGARCNKYSLHCETEYSECRSYKCRCKTGYIKKLKQCVEPPKKATIGSHCSATSDCSAAAYAVCIHTRCVCPPHYTRTADSCIPPAAGTVLTGVALGERCTSIRQHNLHCEDPNSECRHYRCRCKQGFAQNANHCEVSHKLDHYCATAADCPGDHTVCEQRRCQCAAGYLEKDEFCLLPGQAPPTNAPTAAPRTAAAAPKQIPTTAPPAKPVGKCPESYTLINDRCYYVAPRKDLIDYYGNTKSAEATCNEKSGGKLISIETVAEREAISNHIQGRGDLPNGWYCTSGKKDHGSMYRWANGKEVTTAQWCTTKFQSYCSNPTVDRYISLIKWQGWPIQWMSNHDSCLPVCETVPIEPKCPEHYTLLNDHCYYVSPREDLIDYYGSTKSAEATCNDKSGGKLISIETVEEREAISNHIQNRGDLPQGWYCTSGKKDVGTTYRWANGIEVTTAQWCAPKMQSFCSNPTVDPYISLIKWHGWPISWMSNHDSCLPICEIAPTVQQPTTIPTTTPATVPTTPATVPTTPATVPTTPAPIVCPRDCQMTSCRPNFVAINGGCYFFSEITGGNKFAADSACKKMGTGLLQLDTVEENNSIMEYLKTHTVESDINKYYWMGLKITKDSIYTWEDGSSLSFTPTWHNPKGADFINCAAIFAYQTGYNFKFLKDMCHTGRPNYRYICEECNKNMCAPPPPPKPVVCPRDCKMTSCPANFVAINGGCYFFSDITGGNKFAADSACKKMGTGLLQLDTVEENNSIMEYLKTHTVESDINKYYWMGLKITKDSIYTWEDGSSLSFTPTWHNPKGADFVNCAAIYAYGTGYNFKFLKDMCHTGRPNYRYICEACNKDTCA